jgi:PKD repeat protein
MDQKSNQLESFFRAACDKQTLTPSPWVLRKLKFRLGVSDYFSINPRKINVVYTALFVAGVSSALWLTKDAENDDQVTLSETSNIVLKDDSEKKISEYTSSDLVISEKKSKNSSSNMVLKAMFASTEKGCAPLSIQFNNQSTGASAYKWNFGNGIESTVKNPHFTYTTPGKYNVSLTVENADKNKNTHYQIIEVLASPKADFDIDIESSKIAERQIILSNKSAGANNYLWDFGDGCKLESNQQQHNYIDFGVYKVRLVAQANNGCTDTATLVNNFLEKNYELSFPLNFKPNTAEKNDGYYEKASLMSAVFFPRNFGADVYQLNIYAPNGQKVFSSSNIKQGWNGYIGARLAPAGIYNWEAIGKYPNQKKFNLKGSVKVAIEEYE